MKRSLFPPCISATAAIAIAIAIVMAARPALAQTPEAHAQAAARFNQGVDLFRQHAYAQAADAFEQAYALAPHPFALWNAADAREKAGQEARAANLCARFLREAAPDDANRGEASRRLVSLTPRLSRVILEAPGADEVRLDGVPQGRLELFVDPGDHLVTARFGRVVADRRINVVPGSRTNVVIERPAQSETSTAEGPGEAPANATDTRRPLSRTWFFVGAGATVTLGSVLLWSGVDTHAAATNFHTHPTKAGLDEGLGKEHRTNALVVATVVAGLATAGLSAFAIEWRPERDKSSVMTLTLSPVGAATLTF